MTQPIFTPQLSSYAQRSMQQLPVGQGVIAAGLTACGYLLRNYSSYLSYPLYALGAFTGLGARSTWVNEPRFRMVAGEINGQDPNAGVRKLYQDMLHCGIEGDNRQAAAGRYRAYATTHFSRLDPEAQKLLVKIYDVLTGGSAPSAKTFGFHLERLYLELALQNGVATDAQKTTYNALNETLRPYRNLPTTQRSLALLTSLGNAINLGSWICDKTLAFHARSLLVQMQRDPSYRQNDACSRRFQELCTVYERLQTSSFPLKTEAAVDLGAVRALLLPGRISSSQTQPQTTTVSLSSPAFREMTPGALPAGVDGATISPLSRRVSDAERLAAAYRTQHATALTSSVDQRALGTFEGQAAGDGLGLLTEFTTAAEAQQILSRSPLEFNHPAFTDPTSPQYGHRARFQRNGWTDDTDQAILIARTVALTTRDTSLSTPNTFAQQLLNWRDHGLNGFGGFKSRHNPRCMGLGAQVNKVLQQPNFANDSTQAALDVWSEERIPMQNRPAANGAVMRTAILGSIFSESVMLAVLQSTLFARVTHADPRCVASCAAITAAVALFHQKFDDVDEVMRQAELIAREVLRSELDRVHEMRLLHSSETPQALFERYAQELHDHMWAIDVRHLRLDEPGKIGYTYKCMGSAFWALRYADALAKQNRSDFYRSALQAVIAQGGDADTNGCVAGALMGARFGCNSMPGSWTCGNLAQADRDVLLEAIESTVIARTRSRSAARTEAPRPPSPPQVSATTTTSATASTPSPTSQITAFNAWVDANSQFFNETANRAVKNLYGQAVQMPDPRTYFFSGIDALVLARQITGRNAHHSKNRFDRLHPPAVTSSATPVGPFDADAWATEYNRLNPATFNTQAIRQHQCNMLRILGQQTKQAAVNGYTVNGRVVRLDPATTQRMQEGTRLHATTSVLPRPSNPLPPVTVRVVNMDTLDNGRALKGARFNPVVINMANEHTAGGGFENGARAQEENEFRRSNYPWSLYLPLNPGLSGQMNGTYHIPETGVVYTPELQVFRGNEADGYPFMDQPQTLSAIAVAAYDLNQSHGPNGSTIDPSTAAYQRGMREKIKSFLRAAVLHGHDAVVLGALGCGAFRNNPIVVSRLFKEVLEGPEDPTDPEYHEFRGRFREISFAVIDDHTSNGNYAKFHRTLHGLQI